MKKSYLTLEEKVLIFKQAEFFQDLDDVVLKVLVSKAVERQLERNEILFLAGDEATGMFLIAKGSVRAFRIGFDGREQVIHVERAVSTIAEISVFDEGKYPSTAAAEEPSLVYFIDKTEIRHLCFQYPQIALSAAKVFARRLRQCAKLIELLSLREVEQRVVLFLIEEALSKGKQTSEGICFTRELTHNQLAARIGTVREVVTRTFRNLQNRKLVIVRGKEVIIPDIACLRRCINA